MYNNLSDMTSDSVDIFKEEFRDSDEVIEEDEMSDLILRQFGFRDEVYLRLLDCGIDIQSLLLMKEDDMKEIFPTNMLGTRIKFRSRLLRWQQQHESHKLMAPVRTSRILPSPFPTPRAPLPPPPPPPTSPPLPGPSTSGLSRSTRASSPMATSPLTTSSTTPPATLTTKTFRFNARISPLLPILESSPKGEAILRFFEENSRILDEHRVSLVSLIVDYHKDRSLAMSMSDIVRFTEEIGILFPSEEKRYYYNPRGKGLNPVGKLYDKAINARRKIKKSSSYSAAGSANQPTNRDFESLVPTENELENKSWLSQNLTPWVEVLKKWKSTFAIRRADILKSADILENWPLFQNPMGHNLVNSDFVELFPDTPHNIFDEWEWFREAVGPYLREKTRDPESRELLGKLDTDISTDSKDCLIVLLLHAVVKPPLLSTKVLAPDGGSKKRKWKPTISHARSATIMHCSSKADFVTNYGRLKSEAYQKNKTLQPMLAVVGEDWTNLEEFYVMTDSFVYKLNTFIESLDILFKIFYVMNWNFRLELRYLYEFIEDYFFKIKNSSNPNVIGLINFLNDNKT